MKQTMATLVVAIASVLLPGLSASADSWSLPEPTKYFSSNKKFYVEIVPRKLESQLEFFDDKVKGKEPAGSLKEAKDNFCKGFFYKQDGSGKYSKVWESRLSNDVAPVHALVSDSGEHVVSFDNWHSVGYGDNIVAIYGHGGKMVKKMSLPDIFPERMIARLPRSVSSIFWGGKHLIDEENNLLVLSVVSKWSGSFQDAPEYREVKINLMTGELFGEKPFAE